MEKGKLSWCLKQKRGISIIDINNELSKSYINRAIDDFNNLKKQNKVWKVIFSYYICYNSFTSLLYKYGIKSEIHSCTIGLMDLFDLLKDKKDFFNKLKEERENVQYYLKEPIKINIDEIKNFLDIIKLELDEVNQNKINLVLNKIKNE